MSLFFATPALSPLSNAHVAGGLPIAANDNGDPLSESALLHKALRHFAEHGLSAARRAGENAQQCLRRADLDGCRFWLAICRTLDRRLAATTARRLGLSIEA